MAAAHYSSAIASDATTTNPGAPSPLDTSCTSGLLFSWASPLLRTGSRRPLTLDDVWRAADSDAVDVRVERLQAAVAAYRQRGSRMWLGWAVARTAGWPYTVAGVFRPLWLVAVMAQVILLRVTVDYVDRSNGDTNVWEGVAYAVALAVASLSQTLLMSQVFFRSGRVGYVMRATLSALLYRKSLTLAASSTHAPPATADGPNRSGGTGTGTAGARTPTSGGANASVTNMAANDTMRVFEALALFHFLWSAVLELAVCVGVLVWEIGLAALPGVAVMLLTVPAQLLFARRVGRLQRAAVAETDVRTKSVGELLRGALLLKLNAWEDSFARRVADVRGREIGYLRSAERVNSANLSVFQSAPLLAGVLVFATYTLAQGNTLTSARAFSVMATLGVLARVLIMVPRAGVYVSEALVSLSRLQAFLTLPDKPDVVTRVDAAAAPAAVSLQHASLTWSPPGTSTANTRPVLHDINLTVAPGSLVAVIGRVAAGKSSLLSAVLGELWLAPGCTGSITVAGTVAYVPQQAWILNATVRENILCGEEYNAERFAAVTEACCLTADLVSFVAGEHTEIGEGGTTLSGGQMQRVSMARAVYRDADVYVIDDPLSALDASVGQTVFHRVLSNAGLLAGKTRVLVTHASWCLPNVDDVVVLHHGRVQHQGTYAQLRSAGVDFAVMAEEEEEEEAKAAAPPPAVDDAEPFTLVVSYTNDSGDKDGAAAGTGPKSEAGDGDQAAVASAKSTGRLVQAEAEQVGAVGLHTYAAYIRAGGGFALAAGIMVLFLVTQAARVMCDWVLARWSENSYTSLSDGDYTLVYLGVVLGFSVLVFTRTSLFTRTMLRASFTLHNTMFHHVLRAPMRFFWTNPSGRISSRFSKDVDFLDKSLTKASTDFLQFIFVGIGAGLAVGLLLPPLLVLEAALLCGMALLTRHFLRSSRQLKRLEGTTRSPIYQLFRDTAAGIVSVRAFHLQHRLRATFARYANRNATTFLQFLGSSRWLALRIDSMSAALLLGIGVFVALARNSLDAGLVGVALVQALQLSGILQFAVRMGAECENLMTSVQRVAEYGMLRTEVAPQLSGDPGADEWPTNGVVEFRNVRMRYHPDLPPALDGVSFKTRSHEVIGVVGRTGSGKSSLGIALFRIVDGYEGQVLIDGVDIATVGLRTLRQALSVISQSPVLFSGTLRYNLDPFDHHDDATLWQALDQVQLGATVRQLPHGLATAVAESGNNFSVGQRQLLCLARALIKKSAVLFVDEATASVDHATDALIQATIRTAFRHCTVVTIAHRLNTVVSSDRILVMSGGRIAEFGSPHQLLQTEGSHFGGLVDDTGGASSRHLRIEAAEAAAAAGTDGSDPRGESSSK